MRRNGFWFAVLTAMAVLGACATNAANGVKADNTANIAENGTEAGAFGLPGEPINAPFNGVSPGEVAKAWMLALLAKDFSVYYEHMYLGHPRQNIEAVFMLDPSSRERMEGSVDTMLAPLVAQGVNLAEAWRNARIVSEKINGNTATVTMEITLGENTAQPVIRFVMDEGRWRVLSDQ